MCRGQCVCNVLRYNYGVGRVRVWPEKHQTNRIFNNMDYGYCSIVLFRLVLGWQCCLQLPARNSIGLVLLIVFVSVTLPPISYNAHATYIQCINLRWFSYRGWLSPGLRCVFVVYIVHQPHISSYAFVFCLHFNLVVHLIHINMLKTMTLHDHSPCLSVRFFLSLSSFCRFALRALMAQFVRSAEHIDKKRTLFGLFISKYLLLLFCADLHMLLFRSTPPHLIFANNYYQQNQN